MCISTLLDLRMKKGRQKRVTAKINKIHKQKGRKNSQREREREREIGREKKEK